MEEKVAGEDEEKTIRWRKMKKEKEFYIWKLKKNGMTNNTTREIEPHKWMSCEAEKKNMK